MSARAAYVKKFKAQLDEWNAQIVKLEAKARLASAGAKIDYERQIKALRDRYEVAKLKLTQIQEARDEGWEHLKQGLEGAWGALREGVEKATTKIK